MLSIYLSMVETEEEKSLVEELYIKYEQAMYRTAVSILRNKYSAEDAVQDSFIKVINHLDKIREINCNETRFYLVTIVKNTSLNMLRKKQRYQEVSIDEVFDAGADDVVEDEVIGKICSEEIRNALKNLSDADYEILFLYLVKEHTPSEIAQLLDITGNQARQRIFRARQRLIKLLNMRGVINEP